MDKNLVRVRHIFEAIEKIERYVAGFDFKGFCDDEKTIDAVIRKPEIIGEASRNISEDFQKQFSEVPWREISDFRNILIHEYFGVNLEIVWKVIQNRLPELKKNISKILSSFFLKQ